jgi:hypothetical protein
MLPSPAQLIIDPTFGTSVTSLPNAAQYEAGVDYAIGQIESLYTNPITIHIDVEASPSPTVLGDSQTVLYYGSPTPITYSDVVSALQASATDATDNVAYANLPATDPTHGGDFLIPGAEGQALGLLPANLSASDGTFTFGTSLSYTFDPNHRAVAGEFDFIGVAEHEITEIMGRVPGLGQSFIAGQADYLPFDLFRYTAPGVSGVSDDGAGVYYSLNGGQTDLINFNDAALNGGDAQDWAGQTADSFNAFTGPGVENPLSATDATTLDVLGYDLVPEPQTWALLVAGGALLLSLQRRSRRRSSSS